MLNLTENMNKMERIMSNAENSVPTFLLKLLDLLQEPIFQKYVSWNDEGNSFIVHDQASFSKIVLPKYFKHNKFASFVRQLNMYGFRKVTTILQGNLSGQMEEIEFHHPYFIRGDEALLPHIKRKVTQSTSKILSEDITQVLDDVHDIKGAQIGITSTLNELRHENESLWREVVSLRQKHSHQQKVVNRLIQFLVGLVQHHGMGVKRKLPMIENGESINTNLVDTFPAKKPRKEVTTNNVIENFDAPSKTLYVPANKADSVPSPEGPLITELLSNPMSNQSNSSANDTNISTSGGIVLGHDDNADFDISNLISDPTQPDNATPAAEHIQIPEPVTKDTTPQIHNTLNDDRTLEELLNTINEEQEEQLSSANTNVTPSENNQQLALVTSGLSISPNLVLNNDVNPDYLNTSLDKINTNLKSIKRRLSNNEQVQLDYDIIQELFNNSVDITPRQNLFDSTMPFSNGNGQELVQYNGGGVFDNDTNTGEKSEDLNDILSMLE